MKWPILLLASTLLTTTASAESKFPCSSFRKNQDGSLTATKRVVLQAQTGRLVLGRGANIKVGASFGGLNPVDAFNQKCSLGI